MQKVNKYIQKCYCCRVQYSVNGAGQKMVFGKGTVLYIQSSKKLLLLLKKKKSTCKFGGLVC